MAVKKAVSPMKMRIGEKGKKVMLTIFTLIVVGASVGVFVWCVWVPGPPSEPSGPTMTVRTVDITVSSGSGLAYSDKCIGCKVEDVSRPFVKWDYLEYIVLVNGSVVDATVECGSSATDYYVSCGDTIIVTCSEFGVTSRVKLKMLHVPTGSTALEWLVTCTGMGPTGAITPNICVTTIDTAVDGGANGTDKNVSCEVVSVSGPDIKWNDLTYTVLANESVADGATVTHKSADKYVSGGDTIKVTYDSPELGNTTRLQLTIVYTPTGSTRGTWWITCTGTAPTGVVTPTITLSYTAGDNDGNYVNITWRVTSVSRGDVKWGDITIKCFAAGEALTETTTASPASGEFYVSNEPTGTYVEGAQTITIEFNAGDLGGSGGGETAEINLVYTPTRSTAGAHSVTAPKA